MSFASRLLSMPRPAKWALAMLTDATLCILTVWFAFYLRLGEVAPDSDGLRIAAAVALGVALPVFFVSGLYNIVLRFGTADTMLKIVLALFVFGVLYASIFAVMGVPGVPRTVGLIEPVLLLLAIGFTRSAVSYGLGGWRRRQVRSDAASANVLVYGAGAAGQQLVQALRHGARLHVVGFVDDNPDLHGRMLLNLRIHDPAALRTIIDDFDVAEILLAIPSANRQRRNAVIRLLHEQNVKVRTLPGLLDFAHGRVEVSDIKQLEIEDLLGRDIVAPNEALLALNITGKVVAVTGAGGSIGSELCRQIIKIRPNVLLMLDNSEFALYAIHQELRAWIERMGEAIEIVPLLASVNDDARIRAILNAWRPETIYHAAAYKHVPLVEHNPAEGIRNNVYGTMTAALAACDYGVRNFVLISTDKAVRPTNVMGTTKRLAEMILQALAETRSDRATNTCFSMVRFGNVLGSSGSVVPLFRSQIAAGGPITITDPEITRYFMTIPEAAQLVIQAGAMATGGEVFVLDMGDPVRIIDLARNMIELSGLTIRDLNSPEGDIELEVVGLRPGEKLYEELLIGDHPQETSHRKIMRATEHFLPWPELSHALDELGAVLNAGDVAMARAMLQELVPEFKAISPVSDWVTLQLGNGSRAAA